MFASNEGDPIINSPMCEMTHWSEWSSCTTTCGPGKKTKSRNFRHKKHRKHCKAVANRPDLQQTIDCENEPCEGQEETKVSETSREEGEASGAGAGEQEAGTEDGEESVEILETWLEVYTYIQVANIDGSSKFAINHVKTIKFINN